MVSGKWYRRRDLNSHSEELVPKTSVSTVPPRLHVNVFGDAVPFTTALSGYHTKKKLSLRFLRVVHKRLS